VKSIRTLGIAAVMALALTAFAGAGSASAASVFENPGAGAADTTTWNGERVGTNHKLVLGPDIYSADIFSCSTVPISGQIMGQKASELAVTTTLGGCTWNQGGLGAAWTMNGCKYRLRPGAGTENQTVGTLDIVGCEKPMTFNSYGCKIEIGNQSGLGTVTYKSVEIEKTWTVEAIASLSGITYTRYGPGVCVGSGGTFSNGTYTGSWTVTGNRAGKVPVKVFGTAAPAPTKFAAEEAPVTIAGVRTGTNTKQFSPLNGYGVSCKGYTLSGTSASVTSGAITLTPAYKECTVAGEAVPDSYVSTGGCSYVFHANGEFDIAGATCASKPITITGAGCIVTIGPQSGLSGFTYVNEGSGKLRTVSMSGMTPEGSLTSTYTGPSCFQPGTFKYGRVFSNAKLTATTSLGGMQGLSVE
jgi:hypothetical protein